MSIHSILVVVESGGYTPPGMRPDRSPARYPAAAIIPLSAAPRTLDARTSFPQRARRLRLGVRVPSSAVALLLALRRRRRSRRPRNAQNAIVVENALPGNPPSEWDIQGAGDATIQGFATDVSVNRGGAITFKIQTDATQYRIDIYRLGWYGGLGARKVATIQPSATLPQDQPTCITDPATGLMDCGNWTVSASWTVPADATSGLYVAKLVREDPEDGRASHIAFVVRDDDGGSELLFQTSETTWQAYNAYGGNSLYVGAAENPPVPRAHKVSFNRLYVHARRLGSRTGCSTPSIPMIRWLEAQRLRRQLHDRRRHRPPRRRDPRAQGVAVRRPRRVLVGAAARQRRGRARRRRPPRRSSAATRSYWKTRWEPSVDGSGTPYRTLVCYKEGTLGEVTCGGKCDPLADAWTGLWRDGCAFTPPADGCRPENALSGQISWKPEHGPDPGAGHVQELPPVAEHQHRRARRRRGRHALRQHARLRVGLRAVPGELPGRAREVLEHGAGRRDASPVALPRARAARSCSAPARCSGRGVSTARTTAARRRPIRACSR